MTRDTKGRKKKRDMEGANDHVASTQPTIKTPEPGSRNPSSFLLVREDIYREKRRRKENEESRRKGKPHQKGSHESKEHTEKQQKQRKNVERKEGSNERTSAHKKVSCSAHARTYLSSLSNTCQPLPCCFPRSSISSSQASASRQRRVELACTEALEVAEIARAGRRRETAGSRATVVTFTAISRSATCRTILLLSSI
jgi:hypothetical protein